MRDISDVFTQLLESVIVQKYLPATRLLIVSVYNESLFKLFVHKNVKGWTPPVMLVYNDPSLAPKQLILSKIWIDRSVGFGCDVSPVQQTVGYDDDCHSDVATLLHFFGGS